MINVFTSTGIKWNSEIEKHINKDNFEEYLELFYTYQCSPESFSDWEDYVRFCEFFSPDFFGND